MQWIERQRNFLDFTLRSLLRRKGKNGALALVYTLVVFLVASVMFLSTALKREAREVLSTAPELILQRTMAGRHELIPEAYAAKIRTIRGVGRVEPRLWGYYYNYVTGANYAVLARPGLTQGDNATVVGAGVARDLDKGGPGEARTLYFRTYLGDSVALPVAEVLDPATESVSTDLVLLSVPTFRRIFGQPEGMATDLAVTVRNENERQTVLEKILREFPDTRPILRDEVLRTYDALFDWRAGYVVVILGAAILAFFIFAWDKATGLSAEERAEIAVLKAVGWDTADVLAVKFWEGLVVSATAFTLGIVLAWAHVFAAGAPLFSHALKGWAVIYPRLELTPEVNLPFVFTLFFLTVVPYTLVTLLPAWRAAIADPDLAMRQA